MRRTVNLRSLLAAKRALSDNEFRRFCRHHNVEIRSQEIEDIEVFCSEMLAIGAGVSHLGNFHVGYKINQIGKEFDLLKIDEKSIINIEVKQESSQEKIADQLKRNKYYLSFLNKSIRCFTFVSSLKKIFELDDDDVILEVPKEALLEFLIKINSDYRINIDDFFDPCNYLVSPFNSSSRFIKGQYFLTGHQEQISKAILDKTGDGCRLVSIEGGAGTGKSLLVYDIAKRSKALGLNILVIHCGILNDGHSKLISSGMRIISVKHLKQSIDAKFDIIIIDEAQRLKRQQFRDILEKSRKDAVLCVFSHDKRQTLANSERLAAVSDSLNSLSEVERYRLSEKIRTNVEIADFVKCLFDINKTPKSVARNNVSVEFFDDAKLVGRYWRELDSNVWKKLRLTPSLYNSEYHENFYGDVGMTSHSVIGQEFNAVAIIIDDMFYYNSEGQLSYKVANYYAAVGMIFQNITRAREFLKIIIVGNADVHSRCLDILDRI